MARLNRSEVEETERHAREIGGTLARLEKMMKGDE